MEGDSTSMGSSDSESLVGCGYGGGKFHDDSSCKNDSVDDSRLIEVKRKIIFTTRMENVTLAMMGDGEQVRELVVIVD
ncbi:hypothetical protein Tco_0889023 [Tanacetum coccineum]